MQKKLIALAVAGIMAAPVAAQAGVEIYGKARLSVGMISDDNPSTTAEDSKISVASHSSRLGFKGSEDLGNGLTGVWQIETQLDMDNDNNANGTVFSGMRNTFVGIAGDFGTAVIGRHDTPYKMATKDIMGDTYGDYNSVISATHDHRSDNVVAYVSPDMSGFSFAAALVTETGLVNGQQDTLPDASKDNDNDAVSLMGKYGQGPFTVSLAIQSVSNVTGANGKDADATKLGVTYDFGATDLTVIYENEDMGAATQDQDNIYVGVTHALGDNSIRLAIGQEGEKTSNAKDGSDFLALGWFSKLSDNAEWYAVYAQKAHDTGAPARGGLNGGGVSSGFADKTTSALAAGININFSSM